MKALIEKLNEIQRKLKAIKGEHNPSGKFNYRTAEQIMQEVKPYLGTEYVVMINEDIVEINDRAYIKSTAAITDGADSLTATGWAMHPLKIMSMSDPQLTGTASSYAAKRAMGNLFLLDSNPDVDMRNEYAEELEDFTDLFKSGDAFKFYMFTTQLEAEAWKGVWAVFKGEQIPKGEIQTYRERMRQLQADGRTEAIRAQEAFESPDESRAIEALSEYSTDEQDFIRSLS